jgi:hypothetical protein
MSFIILFYEIFDNILHSHMNGTVTTGIAIPKCPHLLVRKFSCSVCKQDYELCEHEVDVTYRETKCKPLMEEWNALNVAVVSKPLDPRAKMTDILLIEKSGTRSTYSWRTLQANDKNNRFKRIHGAMSKGLIDRQIASYFKEFFNLNSEGTSTYQIG